MENSQFLNKTVGNEFLKILENLGNLFSKPLEKINLRFIFVLVRVKQFQSCLFFPLSKEDRLGKKKWVEMGVFNELLIHTLHPRIFKF